MTAKTTGLEFKAFYASQKFWPDGYYHEEEIVTVNGVAVDGYDHDYTSFADEDEISLSGGVVFNELCEDVGSLESHFKKWRKEQNESVLVFSVPKSRVEMVKAAVKAALRDSARTATEGSKNGGNNG